MTDKELRKLKRRELMELLLMQSRELDEQKAEIKSLKEQIKSRRLELEKTGSIAEAAIQVNHVFEAAQAAADQYLENLSNTEEKCRKLEREAQERCRDMEEKCMAMEEETQGKCVKREQETQERCKTMLEEAERQTKQYWEDVEKKLETYMSGHKELKSLLQECLANLAAVNAERGTKTDETKENS